MTDDRTLDYLRRATLELQLARAALEEAERRRTEPIAVVGMACRYPGGVAGPDALHELLMSRVDAIGDFPDDRQWDPARLPDVGGGGFLREAAEFDAAFFGLTDAEAVAMDPQQRLLLETTWELFEHSRLPVTDLRGSMTAVFLGVMYEDYGWVPDSGPERHPGLWGIGTSGSIASGRIAYTFGFEGPAVSVDTACSSSLASIHLASAALRAGDADLAVVGGATIMSTPSVIVDFNLAGGLSRDGRCKSFGAGADGTGWAEGVGLLLLERLSDATRNGHRICAVIRGSAIGQDGASNGLTSPLAGAQERVIRRALASAGVSAGDVDVVEAHGTGTFIGDPVEASALNATYGRGRSGSPVWLGSAKSNIGHTQAAAGVAGVIKIAEAFDHEVLPPTLHAEVPNPAIDWDAGGLRLAREPAPWPRGDRPRRAGISGFGISGTNAHLVLEEPPPSLEVSGGDGSSIWVFSAPAVDDLRRQARTFLEWCASHPATASRDIGWSLATTRSGLPFRAAVVGADRAALTAGLAALAAGEEHPGVLVGSANLVAASSTRRVGASARNDDSAAGAFAADADLAAAHEFVTGGRPDWRAAFGDRVGAAIDLPLYTWNHRRYWAGAGSQETPERVLRRAARPLTVTNLAFGTERPTLVGIPTFLPGSGPQQYFWLAAALDGIRDVTAVSLPGFDSGTPIPGSFAEIVDMLGAAVLRSAPTHDVVLAGYSGGGLLADAVTDWLERAGRAPVATVFLDTYQMWGDGSDDLLDSAIAVVANVHGSEVANDRSLTDEYLRLSHTVPPSVTRTTPSLLVRASKGLPGGIPWPYALDVVEVDADHFSIIDSDAAATAQVLESWIAELER